MRQAGPDKRKTMYSLWFQGHPGPLAASAGSLGASSEPCPSCPPAPRGLLVRGGQQFCFPYFLRGFQGMSPSRVSTPTARSDSQVLPVGRLRGGRGGSAHREAAGAGVSPLQRLRLCSARGPSCSRLCAQGLWGSVLPPSTQAPLNSALPLPVVGRGVRLVG